MPITPYVFTVHTSRAGGNGAVEVVFVSEAEARSYALDRSRDTRVQAVSVSRFTLGLLGTRASVAWYAGGQEQPRDAVRPEPLYPSDGAEPPPGGRAGVPVRLRGEAG